MKVRTKSAAATQPPKGIECTNCRGSFVLADGLSKRSMPQEDYLYDFGIACPHCHSWTHSYFWTWDLQQSRRRVRAAAAKVQKATAGQRAAAVEAYQAEREAFQALFDKEQDRIKAMIEKPEVKQK